MSAEAETVEEVESLSVFPRLELLQVAETVAREKGIEREEVLEAMEQAIQKAGRSKYGHELDIRARIDRKTGEIHLFRYREVAEEDAEIENEAAQLTLEQARAIKPDAEIGEFLIDPLPPIDFGRIAAQTAKQVIVQKVREAERKRQYLEYKDRVGEIVNGLVKRTEFGHVMVDLGRAEAVLRREDLIPRETYKGGDRVRAYIYDVREELRGPQIFLSRTRPEFMAKLFAQEVPEIYDGIIEIRAVARDSGSRAKIAVISNDSSIDPVGACVGMRGSRVQAVVAELQGEKIDIIPWSSDAANFVVNALAPAEVVKVVLDEEAGSLEVIVPDDQLSLAIGRRGQNVRLASQLSGWDIDILTEAEESLRRTEEFRRSSKLFMEALDVDDVISHLLVTEGFSSAEQVAFVPMEDLADIEGFNETVAGELRDRARVFLEKRDVALGKQRKKLGVEDAVAEVEGLTPTTLVVLGEAGVKTLDDLGDLSSDEFRALLGAANQPEPLEPEEPEEVEEPEEIEETEAAETAAEEPEAAPDATPDATPDAAPETDAEAADQAQAEAPVEEPDATPDATPDAAPETADAEAADQAQAEAPVDPVEEPDAAPDAAAGEAEAEAAAPTPPAPFAPPKPFAPPPPTPRNLAPARIEVANVDDVVELGAEQMRRLLTLSKMTEPEANEIIMAARAHWFEDEEPTADAGKGGDGDEAASASAEAAPADDGGTKD